MSKGFKIVLSIIGVIVAAFVVLAVVASSSNESEEPSSAASTSTIVEVTPEEKAELVDIIDRYMAINAPDVTTPIADSDDWSAFYKSDLGFYNITTINAKGPDGKDYLITAWIELSGDSDYTIHYLDTQDGVLIDDGAVPD